MNQIINIDLNKNVDNNNIDNSNDSNNYNTTYSRYKKKSLKRFFNIQFTLSIIAIFIITSIFIYYKIYLNSKEDFSNLLINNYSITKLYSNINTNSESNNVISNENLAPNSIIGIIEIPILNLSYTIFNGLDDELLKTSPCKFYGDFPSLSDDFDINNSNLCIAGHNYDNDKFFSKLKNLNINDQIILYDNFDNKFIYSVIKNYEVKADDLSPVYSNISDSYELTLVTCNNFNGNRIIIKAKIEDV